jgi:hypothetical protein
MTVLPIFGALLPVDEDDDDDDDEELAEVIEVMSDEMKNSKFKSHALGNA